MKKYKVNEIFESIQGEGSRAGELAVFVRFSKCNMKCEFCDTDFASYTEMTEEEIVNEVVALSESNVVVFTGGEPMLQLDEDLVDCFNLMDYITQVETNGTFDVFPNIDHISVSPKDPDRWNQKHGTDLKFLVHKDDFDLLDEIYEDTNFNNYYLQPIDDKFLNENRERALELIKLHPRWRISLQIHKILKIQ